MRNRSGQFASRRVAVDMGEFCHALPRLYFRQTTLMMLMKQDRDKPGLRKNNGHNECDLPGIALPYGWFAEVDRAPRRKIAVADPKALHLSPVKSRWCEMCGRSFDVAGLFTIEDTNRSRRGHSTPFQGRLHGPPEDCLSEPHVKV